MEQAEYNKLIETLKEQVAAEDVEAMRMLGDTYYQGISGNDENLSDALPYWQLAANYGDAICACKVGLCLLKGDNETQGFQYILLYQVHLNSIGRPSIAHLHILHLRF